ncbi:Homeobox protein OTX1 B [Leucoagaricus sp. SymC.cos]|nr:Homeobox protein OTX1 B [Leucoagaricus sp. SymC.cos]
MSLPTPHPGFFTTELPLYLSPLTPLQRCRLDALRLHRRPPSGLFLLFSSWMSGLPTPSRSPNSPPTNITISPDSTTSRTYRLTETTSNISTIEEHEQEPQAPVASSPTASQPYVPNQAPQSSVKRPPSADPQEESSSMTLTKRQRRITTALKQEESQERTSPSSESQDPENENSDAKGKEVEQRPPDSAPVKKKRTRTLTTPHQAAVLHALLAQSRFPTTAMREEVGRSIGLSARKVQIWFQNQRQKARRPRKEPDESTPLPPRYGPFPAYPPQAHSSTFPVVPGPSPPPNPQLLPLTYNTPVQQPYGRPQYPPEPSSSPSQPAESSGRLLGPGVPGADIYGSSYRGQSRGPRETDPSQDTTTPIDTPYSSGSSSQLYSPRIGLQPSIPRPVATAGSTYDQSFNRTLPPLSFDSGRSPSGGSNVSGGPQSHSSFIRLPPPEPSRTRQRSSVSPQVAHFVPQGTDVPSHSRGVLPPPFTLQPEPRWDDSALYEVSNRVTDY